MGQLWDLHTFALYSDRWERRLLDVADRAARERSKRSPADGGPLEFPEFCQLLGSIVGMDMSGATEDAHLRDGMMFDPIHILEVLVGLEEFGITIGDDTLKGITTMADLHFACLQAGLGAIGTSE